MSKADTLLKKATFFERMALYSDRKSFLQALAQQNVPHPNQPNHFQYPQMQQTDSFKYDQPRIDIPPPDPALAEPVGPSLTGGESHNYGPQSPQSNISDFPANKQQAFPSIDPGKQEALSNFVTKQRIGIPLHRLDGKLGPATRTALEAARKYLTEKSPTKQKLNDQQVLDAVQFIVEHDPKTYG